MSQNSKANDDKSLNSFYQNAINVVFAVVIAFGFAESVPILVPINSLLTSDGFVGLMALILAYFIIITSWIGHFKSSVKWNYTNNKLGIARFSVSIFILYLYYFLLSLLSSFEDESVENNYGDTFYVLPIIFSAYTIYDLIKNREYKHKPAKGDRRYRLILTIVFLISFIILAIVYFITTMNIWPPLLLGTYVIWIPLFILIALILIFIYRYKKWKTTTRKRKRKTLKSIN